MIGIFKSKNKAKMKVRSIYNNFMFWPEIADIINVIVSSSVMYMRFAKNELGMFKDEQGLYRIEYKDRTFIAVVDDSDVYMVSIEDWNGKIKPELVYTVIPDGIIIKREPLPGEFFIKNGKTFFYDRKNGIRPYELERKLHDVKAFYEHISTSFTTICNLELINNIFHPLLLIYDGKIYSGITWEEINAPLETALKIVRLTKKVHELK